MSDDEQAIRNVIATWLRASAAGDNEQVLALMADDVVFLTSGHPPMRGKAAFAAAQAGLSHMRIEATSDIQEVRVSGPMAYCWSHLTVAITPDGGDGPMKRAGNVLSIFEKQADGRWLLIRDANLLGPATV